MSFLFYFLYKGYVKRGEKDIPGVHAIGVITVLQIFNLLTLLTIGLYFKLIKIDIIENSYIVGLALLILFFNYIYFYKIKGKKEICNLYEGMKKDDMKVLKRSSILYISLTVIIFLAALFIYINTP